MEFLLLDIIFSVLRFFFFFSLPILIIKLSFCIIILIIFL